MKKRQVLKVLKKCRILFKKDSVLGQRHKNASRWHRKQMHKEIKRRTQIEFSKPEWQNTTVCGTAFGQKIGDVIGDLIRFERNREINYYLC